MAMKFINLVHAILLGLAFPMLRWGSPAANDNLHEFNLLCRLWYFAKNPPKFTVPETSFNEISQKIRLLYLAAKGEKFEVINKTADGSGAGSLNRGLPDEGEKALLDKWSDWPELKRKLEAGQTGVVSKITGFQLSIHQEALFEKIMAKLAALEDTRKGLKEKAETQQVTKKLNEALTASPEGTVDAAKIIGTGTTTRAAMCTTNGDAGKSLIAVFLCLCGKGGDTSNTPAAGTECGTTTANWFDDTRFNSGTTAKQNLNTAWKAIEGDCESKQLKTTTTPEGINESLNELQDFVDFAGQSGGKDRKNKFLGVVHNGISSGGCDGNSAGNKGICVEFKSPHETVRGVPWVIKFEEAAYGIGMADRAAVRLTKIDDEAKNLLLQANILYHTAIPIQTTAAHTVTQEHQKSALADEKSHGQASTGALAKGGTSQKRVSLETLAANVMLPFFIV